MALQNATYNTGLLGATGGQFLDINPPNTSLETLRDIICKKTVSLFEISFVLGWLFGGGAFEKLDLIKKAAYHFGMAFQIADDIDDMDQDIKNKRVVNLALASGKEQANQMFHGEINQYLAVLKQLNVHETELKALANYLKYNYSAPNLS